MNNQCEEKHNAIKNDVHKRIDRLDDKLEKESVKRSYKDEKLTDSMDAIFTKFHNKLDKIHVTSEKNRIRSIGVISMMSFIIGILFPFLLNLSGDVYVNKENIAVINAKQEYYHLKQTNE